MGNRQTYHQPRTQIISLDNFYSLGNFNNIYQSKLSRSSANKQLLHQSINYTESSESVNRYLHILQVMGSKVECGNLYIPILCSVKSPEGFCTDYQTLNLYFQHYSIRLKDQIQARRRYRDRFDETQIWYMLYSIIKAVRMFEKIGISSGNLKTDKIILNQNGHLKVINRLSHPQQCIQNPNIYKLQRFYAPEELRAIRQNISKKINLHIAQTFAIGIIALELCTLIDGANFYDQKRLTLNDSDLSRADQITGNNYSKLLYNLIRTLLSGQYDRPLPSQIYAVFYPYESQILSLKPFNFSASYQDNSKLSNMSMMSI